MQSYDVIIIGSGPAGLSAAIYSARGGMKTLVLTGVNAGGQVTQTDAIENYAGIPAVDGYTLYSTMLSQAESFGAEVRYETVNEISVEGKEKAVRTDGGDYTAKAVVVATGARHRKLGLENEDALVGKGVSYCATCDGGFFRGKDVAVVGGGDTALTEALYLARLCNKVYIVHRRKEYRAAKVLAERLRATENIEEVLDSVAYGLEGSPVEALEVADVHGGGVRKLKVSGVFVAIGTVPASDIVKDKLETENGYIVTDSAMRTSVEGVFAAGDVRISPLRQVITACADGAIAATQAAEYVSKLS